MVLVYTVHWYLLEPYSSVDLMYQAIGIHTVPSKPSCPPLSPVLQAGPPLALIIDFSIQL